MSLSLSLFSRYYVGIVSDGCISVYLSVVAACDLSYYYLKL